MSVLFVQTFEQSMHNCSTNNINKKKRFLSKNLEHLDDYKKSMVLEKCQKVFIIQKISTCKAGNFVSLLENVYPIYIDSSCTTDDTS